MRYIDKLAEPRMQEAVGRGEFDNLPGTGKPLALDDDTLVLPELRAAYRVLKTLVMYRAISNCGRKSPILKPFSPLSTIRAPISDYLRAQLQAAHGNPVDLRVEPAYYR